MTIQLDIFQREGVDNADKSEQARRAVKAFRALQPTLSTYAKMLTKKQNVRVEMAARDNGSTDGNKIYFRPPMELGDNQPHERRLCDKRDEHHQPMCPACAVRERVLVTIYHEIAHICFESFLEPNEQDYKEAIERAIAEAPGRYAESVRARVEAAPWPRRNSYLKLAGLISPYLPTLVNALDDARVNRELFKARKGTKVMFYADEWRLFTQGFEAADGLGGVKTVRWDEQPADMQIIVGVFAKAVGHDYAGWFHPSILRALDDTELAALLRRIETVRSMSGVYQLAFPVLARLRELGFLRLPDDPDQPEQEQGDDGEPEPQPEPEAGGDSDESEPQQGDGPSTPDPSGDEPADGDDPEKSEDEGSGGMESPDGQESTSGQEEVDEDSNEDQAASEGSEDRQDAGEEDSEEQSSGRSDDDSDVSQSDAPTEDSSGAETKEGAAEAAEAAAEEDGEDQVNEGDESADQPAPEEGDGDEQGDEAEGGEPVSSDDRGDPSPDDGDVGSGTPASEGSDQPSEDRAPDGSAGDDESVSTGGEDTGGADERGEDSADDLGGGAADSDAEAPEEGRVDSRPEPDESPVADGEDLSDEAIDTGADDGQGGVQVIEKEANDDKPLPEADPEEVKVGLLQWLGHEDKPKSVEEMDDEAAVDRAIIQGLYFETPSRYIYGVREHRYGQPVMEGPFNMSEAWDEGGALLGGFTRRQLGIDGDFDTPETILGPALLKMRTVFSDNARGKELRHRKSGRVDARVLGKRAGLGDPRLFKKKMLPGKKSYFVLIGMDISGSTIGANIALEKKAVMAQATLLDRMGIPFALYAHSGNLHNPASGRGEGLDLEIYMVKEPHEPWDKHTQERLLNLGPSAANLDGHTLEYYRKRLDEVVATDKILLYYTDGKMPAENHDEELEILQREIKTCRKKGYTLLGVGIRTDSPIRHGLDTVQVDEDADIHKVVKHLEKRLIAD